MRSARRSKRILPHQTQRKPYDEHERYESLLRRSFNAECETRTAVNEVVSGEDLNWHSKNALKKSVPNILDEDTHDAKQLADDHPLREHRSSLRW